MFFTLKMLPFSRQFVIIMGANITKPFFFCHVFIHASSDSFLSLFLSEILGRSLLTTFSFNLIDLIIYYIIILLYYTIS